MSLASLTFDKVVTVHVSYNRGFGHDTVGRSGVGEHNYSKGVLAMQQNRSNNAIRRRVDPMRRVTLPSNLADRLNILVGDHVEIVDGGDHIIIKPLVARCIICGSNEGLVDVRDEKICLECVELAGHAVQRHTHRLLNIVQKTSQTNLKLIR